MTLDHIIPLDKSWMIRLGILDLLHNQTTMQDFLSRQPSESLCDDLQALLRASQQWQNGSSNIDVGESGTLFRYLQFIVWKQNKSVRFIKHGTLRTRKIAENPDIVSWPLNELLKLDNGTSQWASIAVLCGNTDSRTGKTPYKLALTYEALDHWQKTQSEHTSWQPRLDATISAQANAFTEWRRTGKMYFVPEQAEDYCFARAFELITPEMGEKRWPSLRQHESDRIAAMEIALGQKIVTSADHRVVQAIAMKRNGAGKFSHQTCVSKSWPLFWHIFDYNV